MAQPDLSIYQNLLRPAKSVADYTAEMDAADQRNLALQGQRMNLLTAQRAQAEQDELRRVYAAPDFNPSSDEGIARLMRVSPQAGYAAQKARLDARKGEADLAETGAKTEKEKALAKKAVIEAVGDRLKQYRSMVDFIETPDDAARWLEAQFKDPVTAQQMSALGSFEQAVTRIPRDPAQLQRWRQMVAMGMEKHIAQMLQASSEVEKARHNKATEANTIRGQNMTDARARDLNEITRSNRIEDKRVANVEKGVTDFSKTLQKEGIPELETAVSGAEGALGRYKEGEVPGIGPLKNALPAALMSSEGKDVRQALAQVRNIVLSARSGAAVTDQELRRLVEEIGTGAGMSEADIRKGLAKVRERIDSIKTNAAAGVSDSVLNEYQGRGGIPISRGKAKPSDDIRAQADAILGGR